MLSAESSVRDLICKIRSLLLLRSILQQPAILCSRASAVDGELQKLLHMLRSFDDFVELAHLSLCQLFPVLKQRMARKRRIVECSYFMKGETCSLGECDVLQSEKGVVRISPLSTFGSFGLDQPKRLVKTNG